MKNTTCKRENEMMERVDCYTVLMADDDPDDRFLMGQALEELGSCVDYRFVEDGEELMHYLHRSGKYTDPTLSPRPVLIFLDLNMPKKDGCQALAEIKADPHLQRIPVAIWTTSDKVEDRTQCEEMGADAYVNKPATYTDLVNRVRRLVTRYSSQENDC